MYETSEKKSFSKQVLININKPVLVQKQSIATIEITQ